MVKLTSKDRDFFRWLNHSRVYLPDNSISFDEYAKQTKYIGILILNELTSLTAAQIGEMFGYKGSSKAHSTLYAREYIKTSPDEYERVKKMIQEMVFP